MQNFIVSHAAAVSAPYGLAFHIIILYTRCRDYVTKIPAYFVLPQDYSIAYEQLDRQTPVGH